MTKLEDIKLGISPLSDRIYLGTVSQKDAALWLRKRDATSDVCRAVLEWIEPGTLREIVGSDGQRYEIEVRKLP